MRVFQQLGIKLPHSAAGQWRMGYAVNSRNLQPGDLVFFNTLGRGVSHVGVYVGDGLMANANSYQGRTVIVVLHDLNRVRRHFPMTLALDRRMLAWGETAMTLASLAGMGPHHER